MEENSFRRKGMRPDIQEVDEDHRITEQHTHVSALEERRDLRTYVSSLRRRCEVKIAFSSFVGKGVPHSMARRPIPVCFEKGFAGETLRLDYLYNTALDFHFVFRLRCRPLRGIFWQSLGGNKLSDLCAAMAVGRARW